MPNGYNAQLFSGLWKSEVWACGSAGYAAIQAVGSGPKFLLCANIYRATELESFELFKSDMYYVESTQNIVHFV